MRNPVPVEGRQHGAESRDRFRWANERIEEKAVELGIDGAVPFLCECADRTCREILLLSVRDFREIRETPASFVVAPGHESEGERLRERRGGAAVVDVRETRAADEQGRSDGG
jgi:hypothetical protein